MTEGELETLLIESPTLFHMAESGSWPSIEKQGLQSTSALLNLYDTTKTQRELIESQRRTSSVALHRDGLPSVVLRDQIPLDDAGLRRALPRTITPNDWYRVLNSRVFFWLTRQRLVRLLKAGAYRNRNHDVLEVDARTLVEEYRSKIWLSPINTGCTKPFPHPRDERTFQRIEDYPYSAWRKKRKRGERVVELSVDDGVPNIADHVTRVVEMSGEQEFGLLFSSS